MRSVVGAWLAVLALACGPRAAPPEELRIVSLMPSISQVLLAVGAAEQIVGVDAYSKQLPGLEHVPSLGGLFTPDLERTVELRPTLVLAVESQQQHAFHAQLRARGVRVEVIGPHTLEEVLESFRHVGALVGRGEEGRALAERIRAELDAVSASVEGLPRPGVALVVERDPLYVAGGGSFVHALIEVAGGRNVFGDLDAPYPRVSIEALAERAPDVVLEAALPDADAAAQLDAARRHWGRFSFARRVELLEGTSATLPGPDMPETARLLRARIHPERARGSP